MMLDMVNGAIRLGTFGFFPGASIGWNDALAGLNSSRVLVSTLSRGTRAGPRSRLSPWQRKQSSYSRLNGFTTEPAAVTPLTPARAPEELGAAATADLAACGLWQSTQETWRGGFNGSSAGS